MDHSTHGHLSTLVRLSDALTWSDQLEGAIVQTLGAVKEATGAALAPVYLLDARQDSLRLVAEESERPLLEGYEVLPASAYARLPLFTKTLRPVVIPDLHNHDVEDFLPREVEQRLGGSVTNGAVVPLVADGRLLGLLCLSFSVKRHWTVERVEFLAGVGRLLGGVIYHAQVAARVEELAALEERRLISREIHDGISQDISALGLRVTAAIEACDEGRLAELQDDLDHVAAIALQVQKALRDEMVGLRSSFGDEKEDFVARLQACLDLFEEHWFIPVTLECVGVDGMRAIPVRVSMQLLRVSQEALSNTRLHAGAKTVTVRLMRSRSKLSLQIVDDGSGFDPNKVQPSRLGLRIMQERIEQVGGRLQIESVRGSGTRVCVEVPVAG